MGAGEEHGATAAAPGRTSEPGAPGPLLGSGRDADVYAYGGEDPDGAETLGTVVGGASGTGGRGRDRSGGPGEGGRGGWVLRRYRDGRDASREAVVMA
ncbi:hypothetical protein [Streptomyces fuscigenes]|uniref:hypothetical protein n=1 Tax=Streptomyces fuscigenes TaxID=1528880 RepID=UPI001F26EB6E|nr:hypothetical protein [Streptomyces fuscigenes]MCF3962423.1 hypothetical protein [Streptomyces fuscigenes]